jgi:drug/metabolite transporter (DMT)-like permease
LNKQRKAELYILATTFIYGSTFVVAKSLLDYASPLFYTGIRFILAAFLVFIISPRRMMRVPRSTIVKGIVLGVFLFLGFAVQTVGLIYTTTSKSAFFTGMVVVFTPIVHYTVQNVLKLERKPLMYGNIMGVILAALGLYLLSSPSGNGFNIGDALSLGSAFFFAWYIVYLDFASHEPDKLQLTYVQFVVCGVLGFLTAPLFENIQMQINGNAIIALLYLTIFATIISMWVQNQYQGDTTPTRVAVLFSLEPVIAGILGYLVRDEMIGLVGVIGAVIIMAGLVLSEFSEIIPVLKKNLIG